MIKSVWGLCWRTYALFFFVSFLISLIWNVFFMSELGVLLKPSVLHIVTGMLLFIPANHGKGLFFSIFGGRLDLDAAVWCDYRNLIGLLHITYAIILLVVSKTLPITYWGSIKVYGGIFMAYVLPIFISSIVILNNESNKKDLRTLD